MMKGMIIMTGFQCPFCSAVMAVTPDTQRVRHPSFLYLDDPFYSNEYSDSCLEMTFLSVSTLQRVYHSC
mgnify:CR=1 FL=1